MLSFLEQNNFIIEVLCSAWLAVLFIQSGLDKVTDWKGNLTWLTGHFANSIFKGSVPLLLGVVTILEVAAGFLSLAGCIALFFDSSSNLAFYGAALSGVALLCLFTGQRIAKDYEGAAGLVPYFIVVIASLFFLQ